MEERVPIHKRLINVQDQRDVRALEILETAAYWKEVFESRHGGKAYQIESSSRVDRSYHVDLDSCECEDHVYRGQICSHIRAVRLYTNIIHSHIQRAAIGHERQLRQEREQTEQPPRTLTIF